MTGSITIRDQLLSDLRRDEGLRLMAYPDPLTHADPWTIGYGHTGPEVKRGLSWTFGQAEAALMKDATEHAEALVKALPWVATLDEVRQDAMFNMAFNLGIPKLLGFRNTLAKLKAGDYAGAAIGMQQSLWAKQVGKRAGRLAMMIQTGHRLPEPKGRK